MEYTNYPFLKKVNIYSFKEFAFKISPHQNKTLII